ASLYSLYNDPAPTELSPLSLHDALPIFSATAERTPGVRRASASAAAGNPGPALVIASWPVSPACLCWPMACSMVLKLNRRVQLRSEEHTSELQSLTNLVCRLLLAKKKST